MSGAVHGNPIGPEPGDPVVFRGLVEQVTSGGVVEHAVQILQADVVGPGDRQIHPVDDILPVLIVKISITHRFPSCIIRHHYSISIPDPSLFEKDCKCIFLSFVVLFAAILSFACFVPFHLSFYNGSIPLASRKTARPSKKAFGCPPGKGYPKTSDVFCTGVLMSGSPISEKTQDAKFL